MISLAILNHLLNQAPEIRAGLQTHAQHVFCLCYLGQKTNIQIQETGFFVKSDSEPETTITLTQDTLFKKIREKNFTGEDVLIEGDTELGERLVVLLGELQYAPEDDLERLLGTEWASVLVNRLADIKSNATNFTQNVGETFVDFQHEQNSLLVHQQDFQIWADNILSLQHDLQALQARLDALKQ